MTTTDLLAEPLPPPEPTPPRNDLTPRQWVRANLASTPLNTAVSVVAGLAVAWVVFRLGRWVFVTADWTVVRVNLKLFMVGFFPVDELWRLWVASYVAPWELESCATTATFTCGCLPLRASSTSERRITMSTGPSPTGNWSRCRPSRRSEAFNSRSAPD